jgi:hypothetical protein
MWGVVVEGFRSQHDPGITDSFIMKRFNADRVISTAGRTRINNKLISYHCFQCAVRLNFMALAVMVQL